MLKAFAKNILHRAKITLSTNAQTSNATTPPPSPPPQSRWPPTPWSPSPTQTTKQDPLSSPSSSPLSHVASFHSAHVAYLSPPSSPTSVAFTHDDTNEPLDPASWAVLESHHDFNRPPAAVVHGEKAKVGSRVARGTQEVVPPRTPVQERIINNTSINLMHDYARMNDGKYPKIGLWDDHESDEDSCRSPSPPPALPSPPPTLPPPPPPWMGDLHHLPDAESEEPLHYNTSRLRGRGNLVQDFLRTVNHTTPPISSASPLPKDYNDDNNVDSDSHSDDPTATIDPDNSDDDEYRPGTSRQPYRRSYAKGTRGRPTKKVSTTLRPTGKASRASKPSQQLPTAIATTSQNASTVQNRKRRREDSPPPADPLLKGYKRPRAEAPPPPPPPSPPTKTTSTAGNSRKRRRDPSPPPATATSTDVNRRKRKKEDSPNPPPAKTTSTAVNSQKRKREDSLPPPSQGGATSSTRQVRQKVDSGPPAEASTSAGRGQPGRPNFPIAKSNATFTEIIDSSGRTWLQCDKCPDIKAAAIGDWQRHATSSKHQPKQFYCVEDCGNTFTRKDALVRHQKKKHARERLQVIAEKNSAYTIRV